MKQLKLLLTACIFISSTQAFGLSETAHHKAKAAGWGMIFAASTSIAMRSMYLVLNNLNNKKKPYNTEFLASAVIFGIISPFAYNKLKKEYALAFPKKDLKDEKA
jgi:Na+/melibiose symporter-like transporter